jgi:hypothetical protein
MQYFFSNGKFTNSFAIENGYSQLTLGNIQNDLINHVQTEGIIYTDNLTARYSQFYQSNANSNTNVFLNFYCPFWKNQASSTNNLEINITFSHKTVSLAEQALIDSSFTLYTSFFQTPNIISTMDLMLSTPTSETTSVINLQDHQLSNFEAFHVSVFLYLIE